MAAGSMHMGSGPGVAGLSGMHVNWLSPLRTVRILRLASMATMVACLPTFAGAADSALAMSSASVGAALAAGCAGASAADTVPASGISAAVAINTEIKRVCLLMRFLLPQSRGLMFGIQHTAALKVLFLHVGLRGANACREAAPDEPFRQVRKALSGKLSATPGDGGRRIARSCCRTAAALEGALP